MYTSSPARHNQTAKSSKLMRQFRIGALCVLLNKALQAPNETPIDCENPFFNKPTFIAPMFIYSIYFLLNKRIKLTLNSPINTISINLLKQNLSLDTFHDHKHTVAENFKNENIHVFTQNRIRKML